LVEKNNFKGYRLELTPIAKKDIKKLDKHVAVQIDSKLKDLVDGKANLDIKKMEGQASLTYRLRCGDYRIVFEVKRQIITILVITVGHRKEVYRGF